MSNIFSIYWKISDVSVSKDFSTRRNIKKAVLFPRYQGSVGDVEAVCAYVGSKEIDPQSSLSLVKTEDTISENSKSAFSGEATWVGNTYHTSSRYFLLTDVIGDFTSTESIPFYRKHTLPSGDIEPDSVAILNENLEEVEENSYIAQRIQSRDSSEIPVDDSYESGAVYSNYTNSYNRETGETQLHFVRYEVSGATHYQLLNSEPAFTEATVDDISLVSGGLKSWRKTYIVQSGALLYTVVTPQTATTYYLTPLGRSRIIVNDPIDRSDEAPWFLNVSNGAFSTLKSSKTYSYSVPEFASQTFSPLYPYKVEVDEVAEYIRSDILKVDRSPMKIDTSLYSMDILVKDVSGNVLYALTTSTSKGGDYYTESGDRVFRIVETNNAWVAWDSDGIAGWDLDGGFIHLKGDYPDTYSFYVSYYYEEAGYEITTLNVNPVFDEDYNGQWYILYIVPTGGDNANALTQTSSIHYLKVSRTGRIVEASQDGDGGNIDLEATIDDGLQNMHYSISASSSSSITNSTGQGYVDVDDASGFPGSGILSWPGTGGTVRVAYNSVSGNRITFESYSLIEDLTNITFTLHSFLDLYTSSGTNSYQWLVLATVSSGPTSRASDLSIIDLRAKGGVLKEKYYSDAMALDPRSVWARPEVIVSRGQAVPGESVAVVKVPYTLLKDYGGNFTKEEVETIVSSRHLATGICPVVIYHGAIPNISSLVSTTTTVTVCWDSEGDDYSYNVYYASLPDGPWTKDTSVLLSDQIYGNCHTLTGLSSGLKYYVTVTSVSSSSVEGPKTNPWGIRTRI